MKPTPTVLQRMAAGDETASQDCLNTYAGVIRGMASSWFKQPQDVEDLFQDTFIELWRCSHRFDPNVASEVSFVKMVTRRQMINRLRRNGRHTNVPLLEGMDFPNERELSMEQNLDVGRISRMLKAFRPEQRKVLSLFFKLGMSHGEISAATCIALGTVKSYIRRGVQTMQGRVELKKTLSA